MHARLQNPNSEIPTILATLKKQLKAREILYRDIARMLGLSETTVKRYLTGRGLTVGTLEDLCHLAGLRLSQVLMMAREDKNGQ